MNDKLEKRFLWFSSYTYCNASNKCSGAYLIFETFSLALIFGYSRVVFDSNGALILLHRFRKQFKRMKYKNAGICYLITSTLYRAMKCQIDWTSLPLYALSNRGNSKKGGGEVCRDTAKRRKWFLFKKIFFSIWTLQTFSHTLAKNWGQKCNINLDFSWFGEQTL